MPWLSRNNFTPTDKLHADDLNNLANDDRTWGGDVNGGGYTLSNVHIVEATAQAAGLVTSVFSRIGDVVAQAGDYTAAQVGAVPTARKVNTGPGLSGGGPLSADLTLTAAVTTVFTRTGDVTLTGPDITNAGGVLNTRQVKTIAGSGLQGGGPLSADLSLSVIPDTTNQQVQVMSQGNPIGSPRHAINFISGTGALITVSEISASNRIDVTVASTGTGGGMVDPTQVTGDLIVRGLTAPATRLPVGTDGQVLTADHLQALGVKWSTPSNVGQVTSVFGRTAAVVAAVGDYSAAQITNAVDQTGNYNNPPWIASLPWSKITNPPAFMLDPTVAKGDLIVHGAATTRLPLGADGLVLTADSSLGLGVRWGALPVTSVFGRTGAVVAQGGDYTVAQVTGAVPTTLTINTPVGSGLQGGGNLSSNRSLAVVPDTTNQQIQVLLAGAVVGTRHAINFVNGANVSLSISDNVASNQIDLTVSSTGGSGGMVDPTTGIGDLIVRGATAVQRLGVGLNGQVLTCDNTQALGVRWAVATGGGGGGSQSPWIGDVDAAGHKLSNVASIGVNIAASASARVYALVNASEDGFRAVSNVASGMAAASFINDVGDSVCIRSYGTGFVGGLPGLATLEATNTLALLANAVEVMRLNAGHVLIGTTADDGLNALQVNGKIKSKTGGYVFPDNTVQTTAYTTASSPVTSVFTRTGAVVATAGDYTAALVTNAVDSSSSYNNPTWITSLAWSKITGAPALLVDPTTAKGDLIARGTTGPATRLAVSATNGWVLTADSAQALGVKWAAPPAQTPWLSDIDGAGFALKNVGTIGVANDATPPFSSAGYKFLIVGPQTSSAQCGVITACGNTTSTTAAIGSFCGANYAIAAGSDRRIAEIRFDTAGTIDSGRISFNTWNSGAVGEKMCILPSGLIGIGNGNPTAQLDVAGSIRNYTAFDAFLTAQSSSASSSAILSLIGRQSGADSTWNVVSAGDGLGGAALRFTPGNWTATPAMTILQNGNVGIGAFTTPATILHLAKTVGAGVGPVITLENSTGQAHDAASIRFWDASQRGELRFSVESSPYGADLIYFGGGAGTTEVFRATSSGLFGIGVANPQGILDVAAFQKWVCFGSNVGTVLPPNQSGIFFGANYSGGLSETNLAYNGSTTGLVIADTYGNTWKERMRITGTGYLGFWTSAPQAFVHFNATGSPNPQSFMVDAVNAAGVIPTAMNSNGNSRFVVDSNLSGGNGELNIVNANYGAAGTGGIWFGQMVGNGSMISPMVITKAGLVGVGTVAPQTLFNVKNGAAPNPSLSVTWSAFIYNATNASGMNGLLVTNNWFSGASTVFECGNVNASNGAYTLFFRVRGDGAVGIGKDPSYTLDVNGNCNISGQYLVNGGAFSPGVPVLVFNASYGLATSINFYPGAGIQLSGSGGSGAPFTVTIAVPSDMQLKRNVQPLTGGLSLINRVRPVTAEWNGLAGTREGQRLTSVIAQELQELIPDAVETYRTKLRQEDSEDTELLGLNPMGLTCHLILAIQQLERRLKALEQKVN
jgi:hypothetical protein